MLHKQNSCHHIGSSCLQIFLVIFLVYLTRGSSKSKPVCIYGVIANVDCCTNALIIMFRISIS